MKKIKKILTWAGLILLGGISLILALVYFIPLKPTLDYSEPSLLFPNSTIDKIGDVYVHYRIFEPTSPFKGNVFMIHGFAGSTFSWRKNVAVLTENGFKVVCMDLPCFGLSERKLDWEHSPENRALLAWKLAHQIASNENWHLIGHSMGASVILSMGQIQPQKNSILDLC
ncbi:MAG: hypothetical protein KatS3mg035_1377 [Bacteroidia bacterium]|nr:MAG: hypothetical protein KatS3mg035_1377 [Bacteroidia bacterium]